MSYGGGSDVICWSALHENAGKQNSCGKNPAADDFEELSDTTSAAPTEHYDEFPPAANGARVRTGTVQQSSSCGMSCGGRRDES